MAQGEITKNDKIINTIYLLTKQLKGGGEYKSKKHNRTMKHNRTKNIENLKNIIVLKRKDNFNKVVTFF